MKNDSTQTDKSMKPSRRRFIIPAVFVVMFFCIVSFYIMLRQEPKPDPASEKVIREIVAKQLTKDPNNPKDPKELTDDDFAKITKFNIGQEFSEAIKLSELKLLKKFTNLRQLVFYNVIVPDRPVPNWMRFLGKYGIIDIKKKFSIDLSPLGKLSKLNVIAIIKTPIKSIKPLSKLTNLNVLILQDIKVLDIKPLKNITNLQHLELRKLNISDIEAVSSLRNLEELYLSSLNVSDIEPLKNLNNLKILSLIQTQASDFEPLEGLQKLQELNLNLTKLSNLEPLNKLKSLKRLSIRNNENVSDEQIKDLRNALPELKISR